MKHCDRQVRLLTIVAAAMLCGSAAAQEEGGNKVTVSGSVQSDILVPQNDDKIGTEDIDEWAVTNTYAEAHLMSKYIDAGARFEFLKHPMPGFRTDKDFKGWGVPFFYVKGKYKNVELTAGTFYEQFGSGFILRSYEERSLGIDNSLLGGRIVYRPFKGVTVKALTGKQRRYWEWNKSLVSGGDVELNVDQWFNAMQNSGTYLTLGASFVNKHEKSEDIMTDATHKLNLPLNVNAFDVRANLQKGGFNVLAEYAQKTQDPNSNNGYIYRKGYAAMLSTSYSQRGMSILLQAKRSDNMYPFLSNRDETGQLNPSRINHLPAFTMDQTYALAALYPYATQGGEWAYQAELSYKFKGAHAPSLKFNYSYVNSIDKNWKDGGKAGSDGYGSAFWKWGDDMYYQDLNVQYEHKITRDFKLNLMFMNQFYNKSVVEGHGGMVHSNIYIAEGKYRFNRTFTLRGEAQYLHTKQDKGDWLYGLLELSILPNWMITVSDMYNSDGTDNWKEEGYERYLHYYQAYVTFTTGSHRLQLGYGRTRAGYNCSGGVCRYVPASKGLTLSYNYNF